MAKFIVTLVIETKEKVPKKDIREYLLDVTGTMPFDDGTTVRVRSVDLD